MKATALLIALYIIAALLMSCSGPREDHSTVVSDSSDFTYRVIYEDVSDTPSKTQVEQHIEIIGTISHSRMESFLIEQYQEISTRTGYQFRTHPDAVYIYVYAPGSAETDWVARLEKHAASPSPATSISFDPGNFITATDEPDPVPDAIEIGDGHESTEEGVEPVVHVAAVRFEESGDVITDSETGLQWRIGPNRDLDWYEACDWVNGLGGDWRMPIQDELEVLFDAGITYDDPGLFENGGWSVWCGDTRDDNYAIDFDLGLGRGYWGPREASGYIRAFAVR